MNPAVPQSSWSPTCFDVTRRALLRTAGQGLLAAGVVAPLSAAGAAVPLEPPDKQPPNVKVPEPAGRKAGWAIVGLGQLALEEVMPAFGRCAKSRPVALVSGHPDKAKRVAQHYGIDEKNIYNYENYDRLRDNPAVDVVYNILPNHMHAEYTIRALQAGKHVLCEKPMARSVAECEQMIAVAKQFNRKLMIAYRLHYEPYNQTMIAIARAKTFGDLKLIEATNVQNVQAPNIRLSKATAGGPLGDIGVYCLNMTRYITGEEPAEVTAFLQRNDKDERFREVEEGVQFTLRFPSGVVAYCGCNFNCAPSRRYRCYGTKGWFELDPAFDYRGLRLRTSQQELPVPGSGQDRKGQLEVRIREVNHFTEEMDHFSDCVLNDRPPMTPGEEGLADMRVIEKIYESARTGRTVKM